MYGDIHSVPGSWQSVLKGGRGGFSLQITCDLLLVQCLPLLRTI